MTCREVADFLMDYLSGDLSPGVLRTFEEHLRICEACRIYLADYRTARELGRHAFADDDARADEAGVPEVLIRSILASRGRQAE